MNGSIHPQRYRHIYRYYVGSLYLALLYLKLSILTIYLTKFLTHLGCVYMTWIGRVTGGDDESGSPIQIEETQLIGSNIPPVNIPMHLCYGLLYSFVPLVEFEEVDDHLWWYVRHLRWFPVHSWTNAIEGVKCIEHETKSDLKIKCYLMGSAPKNPGCVFHCIETTNLKVLHSCMLQK